MSMEGPQVRIDAQDQNRLVNLASFISNPESTGDPKQIAAFKKSYDEILKKYNLPPKYGSQ